MTTAQQIAKHFRDVFFGNNWTGVNLKDTLADVHMPEAVTSIHHLNSIAKLVFHINYYVQPVLKVLQGGPLQASDKFSFDMPAVNTEEEWQQLLTKFFSEAELFATQVEQLNDALLNEIFADAKYGNYHRNLLGIIEHTHYHLGQISIIKKMLRDNGA